MTSHMVTDSIIVSGVLESTGVALGIIFLAYMGAKIEGCSTKPLWVSSGARKALGFPGLSFRNGSAISPADYTSQSEFDSWTA